MRYLVPLLVIAFGAPAGASIVAHSAAGLAGSFAGLSAVLPDPAIVGVVFGGLGLVVGARRKRSDAAGD